MKIMKINEKVRPNFLLEGNFNSRNIRIFNYNNIISYFK